MREDTKVTVTFIPVRKRHVRNMLVPSLDWRKAFLILFEKHTAIDSCSFIVPARKLTNARRIAWSLMSNVRETSASSGFYPLEGRRRPDELLIGGKQSDKRSSGGTKGRKKDNKDVIEHAYGVRITTFPLKNLEKFSRCILPKKDRSIPIYGGSTVL